MDFQNILASGQELLALYGLKVLGALLVLILGRWVARMLANLLRRGLARAKVDATLTSFIVNVAYVALLVFVVISALGQLGMQTTSFIAVIGAAGLAIGLAFQGSLANFAADERVLKDPAPTIGVLALADSSVNFAVRPWVATADYWSVYFDLNETVKRRFDAAGISIPYPQRDVHLKGQQAA